MWRISVPPCSFCLVESVRAGSRAKPRIVKNLGQKEKVNDNDGLEQFISSVGCFTDHALMLSLFGNGSLVQRPTHRGSALHRNIGAKS